MNIYAPILIAVLSCFTHKSDIPIKNSDKTNAVSINKVKTQEIINNPFKKEELKPNKIIKMQGIQLIKKKDGKESILNEGDTILWSDELYLDINLGEPIESILSETDKSTSQLALGISLGDQDHYIQAKLKKDQLGGNRLRLDIIPNPDNAITMYETGSILTVYEMMHKFLVIRKKESNYVEGQGFVETIIPAKTAHPISLWYAREQGWPPVKLFNFDLIVDFEGFESQKALELNQQAITSSVENNLSNVKLPEEFNDKGYFKDPELSKENIIKTFEAQVKGATVKRLVIEDGVDDWLIEKDVMGNINRRHTARHIRIAYSINGECYFNPTMYLEKPYLGNGKYGSLNVPSSACSPIYITRMGCENLK